jgi:hypothetical protein
MVVIANSHLLLVTNGAVIGGARQFTARSRKSKKDRQYSGKKKDTKTNNDLQNIRQKTKDRAFSRFKAYIIG